MLYSTFLVSRRSQRHRLWRAVSGRDRSYQRLNRNDSVYCWHNEKSLTVRATFYIWQSLSATAGSRGLLFPDVPQRHQALFGLAALCVWLS